MKPSTPLSIAVLRGWLTLALLAIPMTLGAQEWDELDQAQQRMLLLGRKSAEERLASFLIDLAERQETTCLHLPMSRQDIADFLGLTIETVSRLFTRFKRAGMIDLPDRHSVVLQDGVELSDLADGSLAE